MLSEATTTEKSADRIMRSVEVTFANGKVISTGINGSESEIQAYYMGNFFNLGNGENDDMQCAVSVRFL